jgi:hypothetical protein
VDLEEKSVTSVGSHRPSAAFDACRSDDMSNPRIRSVTLFAPGAETIETDDERAILRAMNCKLGQGHLFSKPLPEEHFAALARDGFLQGAGRT